jgi:UDP-glucose 4-epimerase
VCFKPIELLTRGESQRPASACGRKDRMRAARTVTELMLRDAGAAHGLRHVILRYFNVAGADPLGRTGQSTRGDNQGRGRNRAGVGTQARRLGTDYPTPDGTCIRDYIHVSDLVAAIGQMEPCDRGLSYSH